MPGNRMPGRMRSATGLVVGDAVISVVPVELADTALAADVTDGLALVEEGLRKAARAQYDLLDETSAHLIVAGGKRFRATLYHDDVMDEADVRRGSPSANSRWDNSVAILTGDFLFACASKILADLGPDAAMLP